MVFIKDTLIINDDLTLTDSSILPEELITDAFLAKIADNLGCIYFNLGLALNVKHSYIERVEHDHRGDTMRITFMVLAKWRKMSKKKTNVAAMMEELINALSHLGQMDVVELIRRSEYH